MTKQYFSSLFEDKGNGAHYIVVSAADTDRLASAEAQRHLEVNKGVTPTLLGVFSGVLEQLAYGAPFGAKSDKILTNSARQFDFELAQPQLWDWIALEGHRYAASVSPPEELEKNHSPETLTVTFDGNAWWLSESGGQGQNDYLFFSDAIAAGNERIVKIEAEFQRDLETCDQ